MRGMEVFLTWLAAGFGTLLVAAVAVAWWEHLSRSARPPPPPAEPARAVSVDVKLDTVAGILGDSVTPPGDGIRRRATLDVAMGRMSKSGGNVPRTQWPDTSPMVQAGLQVATPHQAPHDEHH